MTASPIKFIGAAVLRTMNALNANPAFLDAAAAYPLWSNCSPDGKLHLSHYADTPDAIAGALANNGQPVGEASLNMPAVVSFCPIRSEKDWRDRNSVRPTERINYRIAVIAPLLEEWPSDTRDRLVFEPILRPVYAELIRQLHSLPAFAAGYVLPHDCYEIYSPDAGTEEFVRPYGNLFAAIEIDNLALPLRPNLCPDSIDTLCAESNQVTKNINNIFF